MKFLVDNALSPNVAEGLREAGHERSMFVRVLIPALFMSAVAGRSPVSGQRAATEPPVTKAQLLQKVVELSNMPSLSAEAVSARLGTRLGPQQPHGPNTSEWPLEPSALVAGGRAVKIERYVDITFRPRPSLGLTFDDVAQRFMDVPYTVRMPNVMGDNIAAAGAEARKAPSLFRVPAGELRVSVGPDVLPRRSPVVSITVTDDVYPEWQETSTLRQIWARQPAEPAKEAAANPGLEESRPAPLQILPE